MYLIRTANKYNVCYIYGDIYQRVSQCRRYGTKICSTKVTRIHSVYRFLIFVSSVTVLSVICELLYIVDQCEENEQVTRRMESKVNENEVKNNAWIWNSNSEGKESSLKLRWLKTCDDLPISRVPITSTYRYIKLFSFPERQNSNKNLSCDFTRQARLIWWDLVTRFDFIRIYFIRKQDIILFSTNKRGRLGRVHTFLSPPPSSTQFRRYPN